MSHTFKYQTTGSSKLPRPFIPLTLLYGNRTVKTKALVDSGADFCMFNADLLEILNLDIDLTTLEKVNLGGVGGTATGYIMHIEIDVENTLYRQFLPFEFSPDEFGGLAGQVGFFDAFKIQFDRANGEVHLI